MGIECRGVLCRCTLGTCRSATGRHLPHQTSLRAIVTAVICPLGPRSATSVAVAAQASSIRLGGRPVRLERRSGVMYPEPAGRFWASRCSRSPSWCRCGSADTPAMTDRSAPRTDRGSRAADRLPVRPAPFRGVPGSAQASAHDGGCRGSRSTGFGETRPAAHGSGSDG